MFLIHFGVWPPRSLLFLFSTSLFCFCFVSVSRSSLALVCPVTQLCCCCCFRPLVGKKQDEEEEEKPENHASLLNLFCLFRKLVEKQNSQQILLHGRLELIDFLIAQLLLCKVEAGGQSTLFTQVNYIQPKYFLCVLSFYNTFQFVATVCDDHHFVIVDI